MSGPKYSYPIQGIFYFFLNPSIWLKCICALLVSFLVALCTLVGFGFLLLPQVHGLIQVGCPEGLTWVIGILLYCLESGVFGLLLGLLGLPFFQDRLFDHVLVLRGHRYVLDNGFTRACQGNFHSRVGFLLLQILLLILSIPVNLIPVIGTYTFFCVNGFMLAWGHQIHNHADLKGMTFSQSKQYVLSHKRQFYEFGIVAFTLEMIPLLSFLFVFTNTIGAALWAADEYGKIDRVSCPPQTGELENPFKSVSSTIPSPRDLV